MPEGERLARRLADATFADLVFFANSGAEANEAAIKMARKWHAFAGHPERFHILTFEGAFHGRTLATLAAGGQQKYLEGFGPKAPGFDQIPITDLDAVEAAIGPQTAAIMIEPIQGEGGVRVIDRAFLRGLREICDRDGLMLIFDEVQTGVGRTGKLYRLRADGRDARHPHHRQGPRRRLPDRGVPRHRRCGQGAHRRLAWHDLRRQSARHGDRQRGARRRAGAGLSRQCRAAGLLARQKLAALKDAHPKVIEEVRGEGLMIGLKLKIPPRRLRGAARARKSC